MSPALVALLLGAVPPAPPLEGFPARFAVDGDLSEWSGAPTAVLGPDQQVAGAEPVAGDADFSARVWVAVSEQGVAVAGQIVDDRVHFPEKGALVSADHAELWVAFPGVELPPMGWANQFGEQRLESAAGCDTTVGVEDAAGCKRWFAEQTARRRSLERVFVRQFLLTPSGVSESWATQQVAGKPPEAPSPTTCCSASASVVKKTARGWSFEARIGIADLPPTSQHPLSTLRWMVDLADADRSAGKLDSFLSTSKERQFGKPSTFNLATLSQPIVWDTDPPLLDRILRGRHDAPPFVYFPGRPVARAGWFENRPVGYQYTPEQPSPAFVAMELGRMAKVRTFEGIALWRGPGPSGAPALWSFVDGKAVDVIELGDKVEAIVQRAPGLHLLFSEVGTLSPLGTGTCGACPRVAFQVVQMDAAGRFKPLLSGEEIEGNPIEGRTLEELSFHADASLSRFGLKARAVREDGPAGGAPWKREWVWVPSAGAYREVK